MGFSRKTKIAVVTIATALLFSSCKLNINRSEVMEDLDKIGSGFKTVAEELTSQNTTSQSEVVTETTYEDVGEETTTTVPEETETTVAEIVETEVTETLVSDIISDEEEIDETETSETSETDVEDETKETTEETEGLKGSAVIETEVSDELKETAESEEKENETSESKTDTSKEEETDKSGSAVVEKVSKDETSEEAKPTKVPEVTGRVDFSSLTETNVLDGFIVEEEKFEENYGTEDETYVTFSGKRLLVSMPNNETPATAINLMLNGFYQEAVGSYNRYCDEKQAEAELTGTVVTPVEVTVNYSYITNERVIAVKMQYEIADGDKVTSKTEIELFDMLTAARITNSDVTDNVPELEAKLIAAFKESNVQTYDKILLVPDDEDEFLIWLVNGNEFFKGHINADEVTSLFNRFGALIYSEK